MWTIGVDPGASGAIVLLENDQPIEWMEMPTMKVGTTTKVNAAALSNFIYKCDQNVSRQLIAYVELVHSMPKQGVASSFNFGHSCGVVEGVLAAFDIPIQLVTPQKWKKAAGLIGTDKDAARSKAIQLYPTWRDLDKKGKGQALADAALIARYGK
jgi:crossover junction endodeoxyribonuclease RuvC